MEPSEVATPAPTAPGDAAGTMRSVRPRRRGSDGGAYLPFLATLYAAAVVSYLFVFLVDPYDLRSVGVRVRLADTTYADAVVPRLVSVAAHDGSDLVLVGASTSMAITLAMLREAFPEAARPVNLSFVSMRADQLATVLGVIPDLEDPEAGHHQHRIHVQPGDRVDQARHRDPLLRQRLARSGPGVRSRRGRHGHHRAQDGRRGQPGVAEARPAAARLHARQSATDETPRRQRSAGGSRGYVSAWVTSAPEICCDQVPVLRATLVPFLQRIAARDVRVDLLLPPGTRWPLIRSGA